jgi:hypothetical protein
MANYQTFFYTWYKFMQAYDKEISVSSQSAIVALVKVGNQFLPLPLFLSSFLSFPFPFLNSSPPSFSFFSSTPFPSSDLLQDFEAFSERTVFKVYTRAYKRLYITYFLISDLLRVTSKTHGDYPILGGLKVKLLALLDKVKAYKNGDFS